MQPINAAVTTMNADRAEALDQYFSPNARVVDEIPPFVWNGSHAASNWWRSVDRFAQHDAHAPTVHVKVERVTEYQHDREGDDAYLIVSLNVAPVHTTEKPEEGLWVLTLHQTGGAWKITSASWATVPQP